MHIIKSFSCILAPSQELALWISKSSLERPFNCKGLPSSNPTLYSFGGHLYIFSPRVGPHVNNIVCSEVKITLNMHAYTHTNKSKDLIQRPNPNPRTWLCTWHNLSLLNLGLGLIIFLSLPKQIKRFGLVFRLAAAHKRLNVSRQITLDTIPLYGQTTLSSGVINGLDDSYAYLLLIEFLEILIHAFLSKGLKWNDY